MMRARIPVAKLATNTLRYFLPPALLLGRAAGERAVCLHHQLLHQQPEHLVSDSAGMAGGSGRDLLPDPLGRASRRHRLE